MATTKKADEAAQAPESAEVPEATTEAAPTIEERVASLEQHVAAALAGAADGAAISAQLASAAEELHGRIDLMGERLEELGDVVMIGSAHGEPEGGEDGEEPGPADDMVTCGACGRRSEEGTETCPRCGAALGEPIG